jgi:hypothetical protein
VPGICGAGIPNAESALQKTLGTIGETVRNNRLTPVFQLSIDSAAVIFGEENGGETTLSTAEAWLSTTSPQVAMAAVLGELYFTGTEDPNNDFGTDMMQPYKAGFQRTDSLQTHVMPASQYRHRVFGSSSSSVQLPFASFYLHTTENAPAGTTLLPLYRMSSKCFGIRKHFYTTSIATRNDYTAGPAASSLASSACVVGPLASDRGYFFDGVEGYVLQQPVAGTVELRIGYKNGGSDSPDSGWALFTADEASRFASYSNNVSTLGYVYPAVSWAGGQASYNDSDGDGLSDGYELGMKLNEQAADGDCDGQNDGIEFPIAGLSNSDPMIGTNCADLRIAKITTPLSYRLSNPLGPNAAQNPTVEFRYTGSTVGGPFILVVPQASGWTCAAAQITYQSQNQFTGTRLCSGPATLPVNLNGVLFTFSQPSAPGSQLHYPTSAKAMTTSNDPGQNNNETN